MNQIFQIWYLKIWVSTLSNTLGDIWHVQVFNLGFGTRLDGYEWAKTCHNTHLSMRGKT
jgi:hypothetical protein